MFTKVKITDFYLYRWRYRLSFIAMSLLLAAMLFTTGLFAPGGLSQTEMTSVARTNAMTFDVFLGFQPDQLIYLPYRLLQEASISAFGFTPLTLKLPSLILAAGSVIFVYGLLRLWFRRNVSVITTILLATSGQFLLQSQQATPLISFLFWGAFLLFTASMIARAEKWQPAWLIMTGIAAALSLYNSYMIYPVIALCVTALIHPHARFVVFKQPLWAKLTAGFVFLVLLIPIILTAIHMPNILLQLLGAPTLPLNEVASLAQERTMAYLSFMTPQNSSYLAPAYGLSTILLAVIGAWRLFSAKYTAKSYIMTIWLVFTLAIILINPTLIGFTLLPIIILIAFGLNHLIRSWYRLFPFNPYARIAGLIPLTILIVGISVSSIESFVYGYHYNSQAAAVYRNDLSLLNKTLAERRDAKSIKLIPGDEERKFYEGFMQHTNFKNVSLTEDIASADILIYGPGSKKPTDKLPSYIVTSAISKTPNRFYVYEN